VPDPAPRVYLSDDVHRIIAKTAALMLEKGAFNALIEASLREMQKGDGGLWQHDDYPKFMRLAALLMGVHRIKQRRAMHRDENMRAQEHNNSKTAEQLGIGADDTIVREGQMLETVGCCFNASGVRSTLRKSAFEMVMRRMEHCFEQKPIDYVTLAPCVEMYKEIVRFCHEMTFHGDKNARGAAEELRQHIFCSEEHITMLSKVFKAFEPHHNDKRHLVNIVQSVHFCTRILSFMAEHGHKVAGRRRKEKRKGRVALNRELLHDLQKTDLTDEDKTIEHGGTGEIEETSRHEEGVMRNKKSSPLEEDCTRGGEQNDHEGKILLICGHTDQEVRAGKVASEEEGDEKSDAMLDEREDDSLGYGQWDDYDPWDEEGAKHNCYMTKKIYFICTAGGNYEKPAYTQREHQFNLKK
jgi:hypothetical protein